MAEITTDLIKQLRDQTSVSVMQCKKALEEAGGDMEKALMILKKKSSEIAAKKSDREALAGILVGKKGADRAVIVELNCETDFVAKNDDFLSLANILVDMALADGVKKTEEKAKELISEVIQKVGENIVLGQIKEITGSALGLYVHDGRIATLVALSENEVLAKDLAMHIAAMNPEYKTREDISEDIINSIREISIKEVEESDKSEDIKTKIVEGKIEGYIKERTLLEQPFFKDPSQTIKQTLGNTTLEGYIRLSIQ